MTARIAAPPLNQVWMLNRLGPTARMLTAGFMAGLRLSAMFSADGLGPVANLPRLAGAGWTEGGRTP
jgi:hypothetical protein